MSRSLRYEWFLIEPSNEELAEEKDVNQNPGKHDYLKNKYYCSYQGHNNYSTPK